MHLNKLVDSKPHKTTNHGSNKIQPVKTITSDPAESSTTLSIPEPVLHFSGSSCGKGGRYTQYHSNKEAY